MMAIKLFIFALAVLESNAETSLSRPHSQSALLQTYTKALDGEDAMGKVEGTPISRVVNLLKEMGATLKKEMDEDEELYEKLACWCNNNKYEKNEAIEAAEAQIADLEAKIEALTAKIAELKTLIAETTKDLAANTEELNTATELRQKQLKEMHGYELDAIQNIENLKAAIIVLGKHHAAFPQISLLGVKDSSHHKKGKDSPSERQFDTFMRKHDFADDSSVVKTADVAVTKFFQDQSGSEVPASSSAPKSPWSNQDQTTVSKAMHSVNAFLQSHGRSVVSLGYAPQSGEILGIMKQLKEEMEGDLSEEQKTEAARAGAFDELREAKTAEIAAQEKLLEEKKAELAQAEFDVANAKEDLEMVQGSLSEDEKTLIEMTKTCKEADDNFLMRKKSRMEEIQAVSATIEILTSDEARDTFNGAYKFVQVEQSSTGSQKRKRAAQLLRSAAKRNNAPQLSVLASSVELDAFTEVKKMIDDLIVKLKTQQADEVKKKDWCDSEFQENTMQTMKAEDLQKDQTQQIEDLDTSIKTLKDEIGAAKSQIAEMQLMMQRAGEARVKENTDFQKTVMDQVATQEILAKALDKLATFYDLLQVKEKQGHSAQANSKHNGKQPAQMEYKKSAGGSGVMSMIEKLIYDAKELEADSKKSESEAQAAYEEYVANTNASVLELQTAVVTKSEELAVAEKTLVETQEALEGTTQDLEDLAKYKAGLHEDCDYLLKNFQIRQESRQAEIESLQQALQILSGAA